MMDTKIVMECGHCGEHTEFRVQRQYPQDLTPKEDGFGYVPFVDLTVWRLLECTKCRMPTLEQSRYTAGNDYHPEEEDLTDEEKQYLDFPRGGKTVNTILYPLGSRINNFYPIVAVGPATRLPKDIEETYRSALRVRNRDPRACAMYIGLTLEAICTHENAKGEDLAAKLNHLANSRRLPTALAQIARQARQIRNMGVHITEDRVEFSDVFAILEFLEIILDYLYIIPAKSAAVKERLEQKNPFFLSH